MESFAQIILIHVLAALSPGPDILLVLRNSIRWSPRVGTFNTLGILTGVALQIALCLSGVALLLSHSPKILSGLSLLGAAYFCYLGFLSFCTEKKTVSPSLELNASPVPAGTAWRDGFLTNSLNPKALLYFISLFSIGLPDSITWIEGILLGGILIMAQGIAFILVAHLIGHPKLKVRFPLILHSIEKLAGLFFFILAGGLLYSIFVT